MEDERCSFVAAVYKNGIAVAGESSDSGSQSAAFTNTLLKQVPEGGYSPGPGPHLARTPDPLHEEAEKHRKREFP